MFMQRCSSDWVKSLGLNQQNLDSLLSKEIYNCCIHAQAVKPIYEHVHEVTDHSIRRMNLPVPILSQKLFAAAVFTSGHYDVITTGQHHLIYHVFIPAM